MAVLNNPCTVLTVSPGPAILPVNHQYTDAVAIRPASDGTWQYTLNTTAGDYTSAEVNPNPDQYYLGSTYYAGWFSYSPSADCMATLQVDSTNRWDLLTVGTHYERIASGQLSYRTLYAGETYRFRISSLSLSPQVTTLTGFGFARSTVPDPVPPAPTGPVTLDLPVTTVKIAVRPPALSARVPAAPVTLDLPTTTVAATAYTPTVTASSTPPPTPAGGPTLTLSSPAQNAVVATGTPHFVVALTSDADEDIYTVEIQYSADASFGTAVTLSSVTPVVEGGAIFVPADQLPPGLNYWRARLLAEDGTEVLAWTAALSFTVNSSVTASTLALTWTVSDQADRPIHLWHITPPGPAIGDMVTVFGQGFPDHGHLTFGDAPLDVVTWQLVDASAAINSDERVISGTAVDCEHYEVTFIAPNYSGPGAALTVEA